MPPVGKSHPQHHVQPSLLNQASQTEKAYFNHTKVRPPFLPLHQKRRLIPLAGLPRPAKIAISGSFFLFALAGYYYEPYVLPLPDHQPPKVYGSEGGVGGEKVLVDAREGERVPVRLSVVERSVTRGS
jgi:hypothetical protein